MSGIHNNKARKSNWGRPTTTTHKLGSGTVVTLADCVYDGLGRLTRDRRNGTNPLDTRYSYNVRNWLTELRVGFNASTNTLGTNYLQDLYYNVGRTSGATPQWAGNISGMSWKANGESVLHSYDFTYDGLSRLIGATSSPTGGQTRTYTYDKHFNVQSVTGGGASQSFSYTGNQLTSDQHGGTTTLHTYDRNGRLSTSGSWSYYYNAIGLPSVQASSGGVTRWVYAADGTKLSRETLISTAPRMDYVSNLVYKDSTLNRVLVTGGYIDMTGSTPAYRFFVTDHQGNVRLVTDATGTPLQVNHYDPFGNELDMTASTSPVGGSAVLPGTATANPYKYSGKEWDDQASLYDFSARMYNPSLARFTTMGPLCEKYYSISPYAYCAGNPVNLVDPDGVDIYRYDADSGEMILHEETSDEYDQIGVFGFDSKTGDYYLRTKKDGSARIRLDNIEKGILTDGMNMYSNNLIELGTEGKGPSIEGVQDFLLGFSNTIDREVGGYYVSLKGEEAIRYVTIGNISRNTSKRANPGSPYNALSSLPGYDPTLYDIIVNYHTHLSRFSDSDRLHPSSTDDNGGDIGFKERQSKNNPQMLFLIITNPSPFYF